MSQNKALLLISSTETIGMLSGIKECKVKFKGQDEIFKTALLVPSQEVTGYNPEIILLRILS